MSKKSHAKSDDRRGREQSRQRQALSSHNLKFKKRVAAIQRSLELLEVLRHHQPMSSKELLTHVCVSKSTLRKQLQTLVKHDLVKQIDFEQHVLYCIDGQFNHLIFNQIYDCKFQQH